MALIVASADKLDKNNPLAMSLSTPWTKCVVDKQTGQLHYRRFDVGQSGCQRSSRGRPASQIPGLCAARYRSRSKNAGRQTASCSPQNGHDNDQQSPPPEPRQWTRPSVDRAS